MKILQVITRFNPKHGGTVDVVANISKLMTEKGNQVTIITTDYEFDDQYADLIRKVGVEIIPFKHIFNFHLYIYTPSMKEWIRENIKNYDIIHLNASRSYQNSIIFHYATLNNVPYVLQTHGSAARIVELQKLKALYDLVWGYKVFNKASKLIALNRSESESLKKLNINEDNIEIIPNGIDLSKFVQLPSRGAFRNKYAIDGDEKLVLYIGRLHKSKSLDLLIGAFAKLVTRLDNCKLIIAGPDDNNRQSLKRLSDNLGLEGKIIFAGHISDEEKYQAFVDADVFVTPRFYGFPITFAESCACGLPIVTTNSGDQLDWIDNKIGYVVNPNESEIEAAILRVLTEKEMHIKFSNEAKLLAKNQFNWEKISVKLEGIYADAICSKGI